MGTIKLAAANAIRIDSTKMGAVLPSVSGYFILEEALAILQKNILNYFIEKENSEITKEKKTTVTVLPAKKDETKKEETKKETSSVDLSLADLLKHKGVK